MYGFTAIISNDIDKIKNDNINKYKYENVLIINNMIDKFKDDKVFYKFSNLFFCIDGVILNKKELINKYAKKDLKELCNYLYKLYGIKFIEELRGNFNGFIYDKNLDKSYIFTNHLGTKFLYYYKDNKNLIVSSKISEIIKYMRMLNLKPKLDELGAYFLLSYGYMLDDYTLLENIKKVRSGNYLEVYKNTLTEMSYYFIDNETFIKDDLDNIIKNLYERFSASVKKAFDKDLEYGYKHIQLLSGGLDSRMIAFFAKKLGYKDMLTISFGQSDCLDEKIANEISKYLKFEHLMYNLDNGEYLKKVDKCVALNDGQIIYQGLAHANSILSKIDWKKYGLLHNGNIADIMHGDYLNGNVHIKPQPKNWTFSNVLFSKVKNESENIAKNYNNDELFNIYNRGLACNNGSIAAWNFTETDETYLYFDLIRYATKMPPKYKYREYAFIKMINKYIPEASNYIYASWGVKPTMLQLNLRKNYVYRRLQQKYNHIIHKFDMNPYDKWLNENKSLQVFQTQYFNNNIYRLNKYSELKKDCIHLFNVGNCSEKLQVLNLLSAYKQLVDNDI